MAVKWQSGSKGTYYPVRIGEIPDVHGRYEFNPNACLTSADVKGGGYYDSQGLWQGSDHCIACGPIKPPPPPPPPPPIADVYSISVCFGIFTGPNWSPQGCWLSTRYVNYDGPPPQNFTTENGPLTVPTIYRGQTLTVETTAGSSINGIAQASFDSGQAESGSVYTADPNNPSGPGTFDFNATQAAANSLVNTQIAAAHAALGL